MDEPALTPRTRRAVALIAASLTVIVVAGLLYLHPNLGGPTASQPSPRPSPTPPMLIGQYITNYAFVDPSVGWALVVNLPEQTPFWIFKTTDGAKHWVKQYTGKSAPSGPLRGQIKFFDRSHGIVVTGPDAILRTADGGDHWTRLTVPFNAITSVTFSDPMRGWAGGAWTSGAPITQLASTADGGDTWTPLPPPPAVTEVFFRNPFEGWAGGADPAQPTVYSSRDGGWSWTAHQLPTYVSPVEGKAWMTLPRVYLISGRGVMAMILNQAYASFDGGEKWRHLVPAPAVSYYEVAFEDATHWWAMQQDGDLYKTSDSGDSWRRVAPHHLNGVRFVIGIIDSRHAWVQFLSGSYRQGSGLALTSDGGLHWTYANVPNPP